MHIRMQVRGSDKKRPQLAATACRQSNSYHCHSRVNSHVESGYEEKKGMGRRGIIPAPPPPVQPYQTVDRKNEAQRLMRTEILVSNPVCLHGGLLQTVGWNERRARPIIRGAVVLLLCAERGGLARASSLLAGTVFFILFFLLSASLFFPISFCLVNQRASDSDCTLQLMTTAV